MGNVYCGAIFVENDDFKLEAAKFIVRGDEVAFEFEGKDEWGRFEVQGVAKLTEHGFFMAPRIDLVYSGSPEKEQSSIKFYEIDNKADRRKCWVKGVWIQDGDEFPFSGALDSIKNAEL